MLNGGDMSTFPQRVADNILPLSSAGVLPDAFKEWYFTEAIEDHEQAEEICQLCDQEELRYLFEIKNEFTHRTLWVGSSCILKFQLQVFESGQLLDSAASRKKLEKLKQQMRLESCVKALRNAANKETNDILANALTYYQKYKFLTPKLAFVVFWRLAANKIDHSPSFFKISLKKDRYKLDLAEMPKDRVHMIWPALTSSQRKLAQELGHEKPVRT